MFLVLFAFACALPETSDEAPRDTDSGLETTWFSGTSDGQSADGTFDEPAAELLFVRILDRVASTIEEQVWTEQGAGDPWEYDALTHAVDPEAGTFTADFVTDDGTLEVVGGYDAGEPWAWTAWHSTSTYVDGIYAGTAVLSEDSLAADGVVTAEKEVYDAGGAHTWSIVEVLTPISEADHDARLAEVTD